jgi:hypothetical protein
MKNHARVAAAYDSCCDVVELLEKWSEEITQIH